MNVLRKHQTDDLRVAGIHELAPPSHIIREFPCTESSAETVYEARQRIRGILHGLDRRLVVVVGPCSIHDPSAAIEYAGRLAEIRESLKDRLEIVMRVYFEKPRTTVGWKGFINDPNLDGSFQINTGLRKARELLLAITEMGLPVGTEYLDMISPQYLADLVCWGAIGARTTESQVHRELASGLSCPVGFKNGTNGNLDIAVEAVLAARHPHHFLSVTKGGHSAIVETRGNEDGHIILRGGKLPNYDADNVRKASEKLSKAGLEPRLMIDLSHANSGKIAERQLEVSADVARQIEAGDRSIFGVMAESHLLGGRQDLGPDLAYGQSITDSCLGWSDTELLLDRLARAVG